MAAPATPPPTPIQERGIPVALDGPRPHRLRPDRQPARPPPFSSPILHRLAGGPPARRPARALVVTPTRELAAQIGEMAERYGAHLRLRSAVVFGGVGLEPQTRRLRRGLDLLVATPGRLLDHLRQGHAHLDRVEAVVLDEADRMLDMGFLPDVRRILGALPAKRQNLFFSATMPDEIEDLIRRTTNDPAMLEVARRATPVGAVSQTRPPRGRERQEGPPRVACSESRKWGQTLVFTRTKARANQLAKRLDRSGRRVAAIHGNKSQSARTRALANFRDGRIDTLVATDIAARGIDVDGISHVVNFDLPTVPEDYVHRNRAHGPGPARAATRLSLAAPEERPQLAAIERLVGRAIPKEIVPGFAPADAPADAPRQRSHSSRPGGGHHRRSATRSGRPAGRGARAADTCAAACHASSPWWKSPLHSSSDASRLTALFVGYICPTCALLTPCQAGASLLSVQRGVPPRAASGRPLWPPALAL